MKKCTKCKRTLSKTEFYRNKRAKDGLHVWCKECNKEYYLDWYQKHGDKILEAMKKHRLEHNEEIRKEEREHRINNKKERQKYEREWYRKNKKEIRKKRNNYRQNHKKDINAAKKLYSQTEKGKESDSRSLTKRRHNYAYIPFNIFGESFCHLENDGHHCNDAS